MAISVLLNSFLTEIRREDDIGVTDIVLTRERYLELLQEAYLMYREKPTSHEIGDIIMYLNTRIHCAPDEVLAIPGDQFTAGADFTEFLDEIAGACKT